MVRKNLVYQIIYRLVTLGIPLLTSPYLASVFGPEKIGIYSFVGNVVGYFVMFVMCGISLYGNRQIALSRDDPDQRNRVFSSLMTVHVLGGVLVLAVYIPYILLVPSYRLLYVIQTMSVVAAILDISWFYSGIEEFRITVNRNMIVQIISAVGIFLFIRTEEDLVKYVFLVAGFQLAGQIWTWLALQNHVSFCRPSVGDMTKHLKPLLVMFLPVIALSLYQKMDKIIVGMLADQTQVGYYVCAERIISIPLSLFNAVTMVLLPRITNCFSNGRDSEAFHYIDRTMKFILFLSVGAFGGIAVTTREFTALFWGEAFYESGTISALLAVTIPIVGMSNVVGTTYLLPRQRDGVYLISLIVGGGINIILDLFLVPLLGAKGAAVGTICAEASVLAVQWLVCFRDLHFGRYAGWLLRYGVAGIGMAAAVLWIAGPVSWCRLILEVAVGGGLYVGLVYLALDRECFALFRREAPGENKK